MLHQCLLAALHDGPTEQLVRPPGLLAGGLLFYDFGMMSEIGTARRGSLLEFFYGVYRRDADAVIAALIDLGIIVPTADAVPLRRAISFSLDNLLRKVSSRDIS